MKKNLLWLRLFVAFTLATFVTRELYPQALLVENFNYPSGSQLTANGWVAHSGEGNNPVSVTSTGLIFSGYPSSNQGLAAILNNDGEDVSRTFTTVTTGTVYCGFLVRAGSVTGDYFLHLSNSGVSANRARVFLKGTGSSFNFGLSKGSETTVYTSGSVYATGTTYLIILKYTLVEGSSNDLVSLYVFTGTIPSAEPATPTIGPINETTQSDLSGIASVALRQYSATQNIIIDGIRVAQKWEDIVGVATGNETKVLDNYPVLYPNPVHDNLSIRYHEDIEGLEIMDNLGRVILKKDNSNGETAYMDVSALKRGLYSIRIVTSTGVKFFKILKL
jgi:hypothetical protein